MMQSPAVPEPAVAVGEDPRSYARLMSAVYDATMSGGRAPARPRDVIGESWQRMLARGVNPDTHIPPVIEASGLDALRKSSGLLAVLDDVSRGLESIVAEGDNILVLADARGRVLWRSGSLAVLGSADRLGFIRQCRNLDMTLDEVRVLLRFRDGDANVRSVWLCTRNDLAHNLGVAAAGGLVWLTGSRWPDLAAGALLAFIFLQSAWSITRQALVETRVNARSSAALPGAGA